MDGLNLRSAVAGVVLIAVLVLVALFDSSESGSDEPSNDLHAFRNDLIESGFVLPHSSWITGEVEIFDIEQIIDDEEAVFSAIYQNQSLEGDCLSAVKSETYKELIIQCDISEDVTDPDWDDCGTHYELTVLYPLKSGAHADTVNSQIRESVSTLVSTYLTRANERAGCIFAGNPDRGHPRIGYFWLNASVSFANDELFSVHLGTDVHDPAANTSNNYLDTLNFDLSTGKTFSLADMLYPGEESYRAFQRAALAEANYLNSKGLRGIFPIPDGLPSVIDEYRPELLEEQEFVLTETGIKLDCNEYCFEPDGMSPVPRLLDRRLPLEIPFPRLENFWDPEGPFRHLNNPAW